MRARAVVPFVIFLLIGQIGVVGETAIIEQEGNLSNIPAGVTITDYIDNPNFNVEPDVVVNSTSGEFSANYHQAADDDDFNYMELNWTHVANTSLDFREFEDSDLPDCLDLVYFYQEFDWSFNEMPLDAEFRLNFSTSRTGSFAVEEYAQLMFRVYVWMIDSSGHWQQVYKSFPPYYETYEEKTPNLSYFDILEVWGGMIEDSGGLQEDPTDTVQVAIGLAPTFEFDSFFQYVEDPWEFYNGTVSIRVSSMNLFVYMEEEPDPSQVLSPKFNSTWEYSTREVFPDVPEEFENSTEWFRDIEIAADGSVYVLCDSRSSYELYQAEGIRFAYLFLLKYSPKLKLVWAKHLENQTNGYAMAIHDGYIYTTGYVRTLDATESKDLIVTKWAPDGEVVWNTQWGGIYDEEGSAIAVSSDGCVFVWSVHYNLRFEPEFWESSFLKFDSSGTLLWNRTSLIPLLPGIAELEALPDGLYSWDSGNVEKRNLTCEPLWNIEQAAYAVNFDDKGNIYVGTGGYGSSGVTVSKWDSDGSELWSANYSIPLGDVDSLIIQCRSIDVAPDGSVLVVVHEWQYSYDYHMLKFDSAGNFIWDKMIGDERWQYWPGYAPKLEMGKNGLAYVGFDRTGDFGYEVAVSAFVVGPYREGLSLPTTMLIVGLSGVALVGVIAIYIRKNR